MLHRNFKVPEALLGSFALCKCQHSNAKRDGAFVSTSKHGRTAHWISFAFNIILINVFCPSPLIFKATAATLEKRKSLYGKRTITMHILGNSCLILTEAPKANRKFLWTTSFGQVPNVGVEWECYSPHPGGRDRLPTEVSPALGSYIQ